MSILHSAFQFVNFSLLIKRHGETLFTFYYGRCNLVLKILLPKLFHGNLFCDWERLRQQNVARYIKHIKLVLHELEDSNATIPDLIIWNLAS